MHVKFGLSRPDGVFKTRNLFRYCCARSIQRRLSRHQLLCFRDHLDLGFVLIVAREEGLNKIYDACQLVAFRHGIGHRLHGLAQPVHQIAAQ